MSRRELTRRTFLMGTAAAMGGCATGGAPKMSRGKSANEKLNIAGIGVGGKGKSDIYECRSENIVALCDVDDARAADMFTEFSNAARYKDFRVMLEKHPEIDAVTISTPDHMHAYAALIAMEMGKHVYVQKPLTHNVYESRLLTHAARKYGVVTQMGNQGHSGEGVRRTVEIVRSGMIGPVREVHCWTDRPGVADKPWWPQAVAAPLPGEEVPEYMDWDLWLGVAADRPYNRGYAPFNWRGWWDFGSGALGDMACHVMDPAFWALELGAPSSVECLSQEGNTPLSGPLREVIRYEFPARGDNPAVTLYWYDGGNKPAKPESLPADEPWDLGGSGSVFVGDDAILMMDTYGENPRLKPSALMEDFKQPDPWLPRVAEMPANSISDSAHRMNWIEACKGGPAACSNFDYSGPFSEMVLLGTIAARVPGKLVWNTETMRFANSDAANGLVWRHYRPDWELPGV